MAWRAECRTCSLVCSPPLSLFIVGSVFLIQMASYIQHAHLFVSLSTTFVLYSAYRISCNLHAGPLQGLLICIQCLLIYIKVLLICTNFTNATPKPKLHHSLWATSHYSSHRCSSGMMGWVQEVWEVLMVLMVMFVADTFPSHHPHQPRSPGVYGPRHTCLERSLPIRGESHDLSSSLTEGV